MYCPCGYATNNRRNLQRHVSTCAAYPFAVNNEELKQEIKGLATKIEALIRRNDELSLR